MSDTNPTRKAAKLRELTPRQFVQRIHNISHENWTTIQEYLLLGHTLSLSVNDLRLCDIDHVMYPLSMLVYTVSKTLENFGQVLPDWDRKKAIPSLSHWYSLNGILNSYTTALGIIGTLAITPTKEKALAFVAALKSMVYPIQDIIQVNNIDLKKLLFLAWEFGKVYGGSTDYLIKKYDSLSTSRQEYLKHEKVNLGRALDVCLLATPPVSSTEPVILENLIIAVNNLKDGNDSLRDS